MDLLPIDPEILPPSDDRVFKLIFAPEESNAILKDLISAILDRPVLSVKVRNSEIPPEDVQEKAEKLDVNCFVDEESQVDLEMHASHIQEFPDGQHRNLKGKILYYLCDLHSSQPAKGEKRYDKLSRTYQVTFCSYTVFPERPGYFNSFSMRHDEDNGLFSDALHIVFVELSKLREIIKKPVDEMTGLEKWAVFLHYADKPKYREKVNEVIASKEVLQMAMDRVTSISRDDHERAVYRSRRMYQTDLMSNLATAKDIGIQEGLQQGQMGMALAVARIMMASGEPDDKIMLYTGLSLNEIGKVRGSSDEHQPV